MKNTVTAIELSFIIFLVTIVGKLHALPSLLAGYADESLWISVLICFAVDFILLLLVLYILNKIKGVSFYDALCNYFGKFTGKVIAFIFVLFMIAKIFLPVLEQKNSIELTFYETQPSLFTFLPVYLILFYVSLKGLWAFSKSVNVIIWGLIVGVIIVLLLSLSATEFNHILPLFAKPFKNVLNGSFKSALWFGDPLYLLFFSKHVDNEEKINKKIIIAYIISVLVYTVGLIIFYSVFENIAVRQYFAPLKMSKYSVTLSNIGRFDYLATLLIITANVYALALPLAIASNLLTQIFNFKNKYIAPLIVTIISLTLTIIFEHGFYANLDFCQNYLVWFLMAVTYILPIITALLLRRKHYERI